jgi:hypothetical protein
MPRTDIDYSKTIIYKIVCNDLNVKDVYVGNTTDFTRRKNEHKNRCKDQKQNTVKYETIRKNGGWNNWLMIEIEKYPCLDGNEARSRERYWIEFIEKSTMNMILPIRNEEEVKLIRHEYYEKNKEHLQEKNKKYYIDNKDLILVQCKEYKEINKEKLSNQMKDYYEKNKQQILLHCKECYNSNKERIKIYQKENQEKIKMRCSAKETCICGAIISYSSISTHKKTKKHMKYLETQEI